VSKFIKIRFVKRREEVAGKNNSCCRLSPGKPLYRVEY
jgi:hypothetical protein